MSVQTWKEGKVKSPDSYVQILKSLNKGDFLRGGTFSLLSQGASWFGFLTYVNFYLAQTDQDGLKGMPLLVHSLGAGVVEVATFLPFSNMQRYLQLHHQTPFSIFKKENTLSFYELFLELYKQDGLKTFYRGAKFSLLPTTLASMIELGMLRLVNDKRMR
ncbi:MAG TPA: MC/SLC25 family protein [Alphaproteobacteria bacterium]|nr:MC/SLC25 family protein [Alphaproteobacteria bacterium]